MSQNWIFSIKQLELSGDFNELKTPYGVFYHQLSNDELFHNQQTNTFLFVDGECLPRLDSNQEKITPEAIENLLIQKENPQNFLKGIYTIVYISESGVKFFNDQLGISKFFYDQHLVSNRFDLAKKYAKKLSISKLHISEYFLFNYFINGNTIYNELNYSKPATQIFANKKGIYISEYFDLLQHLKEIGKNPKKQRFKDIGKCFTNIIKQYYDTKKHTKPYATLTAGLDSRVILATLINTYKPSEVSTFTFGNKESSDVMQAIEIAKKEQIPHYHIFPDPLFFDKFEKQASKTFDFGNSFASIYRAHRLDAYTKIKQNTDTIVMGMAGSDLVRGIGYDGLIVTPIAKHLWKRKSLESYFENSTLIQRVKDFGIDCFEEIKNNYYNYKYISHPIDYLFKVIVPLHFSQDISINTSNGINTFLPFLDLEYLEKLAASGYLDFSEYSNFKNKDIRRRMKGIFYSAKFVQVLNKRLAKYSLGKGYSPNDIVKSRILFLIKGYLYKKKKAPKVANISYGQWYYDFLKERLKEVEFKTLGIDGDELIKSLEHKKTQGDELYFLDFTKVINLDMMLKS
jgi:hypothetical protein